VEDLHEGETAQRLARVYDADVVAIGHEWKGSTCFGVQPVLAAEV
jgi:hypothetical protein